jgi:pimeloyl-ACP methyl ester carboxylesterase
MSEIKTERVELTVGRWTGIAGEARGLDGARTPVIVFLHGLTFDRAMWRPTIAALPADQPVLSLDLPGHGGSPAIAEHQLEPVAAAIHAAVEHLGVGAPVLVGHSMSAQLAAVYATRYPAAAVVNVDQPLRIAGFVQLLRQLEVQLRGPAFPQVWQRFRTSMHMERLDETQRALLSAGETATQQVVLGYWQHLLERDPEEMARQVDDVMATLRALRVPYVAFLGNPLTTEDRVWFEERLPAARFLSLPLGHHFPHLARPEALAGVLTGILAALPAE